MSCGTAQAVRSGAISCLFSPLMLESRVKDACPRLQAPRRPIEKTRSMGQGGPHLRDVQVWIEASEFGETLLGFILSTRQRVGRRAKAVCPDRCSASPRVNQRAASS
jgi:hypothetical protein